jgi:ComF family protein
VLAPWAYEGAARALVLQLKLQGRRSTAAPLVEAMCREVTRRGLSAEAVTWVPGRAREARRRGFDHAEVLARDLARRLGLRPVRLLRRTRASCDQAGLGARERRANLAGAFASRSFSRPVVLVDDLVTTGATAAACAAALRAAGVPRVEVLAPCCA